MKKVRKPKPSAKALAAARTLQAPTRQDKFKAGLRLGKIKRTPGKMRRL